MCRFCVVFAVPTARFGAGVVPVDVNRQHIESADMSAALSGTGQKVAGSVTKALRASNTHFSSWEEFALWLKDHGVDDASISSSRANFSAF